MGVEGYRLPEFGEMLGSRKTGESAKRKESIAYIVLQKWRVETGSDTDASTGSPRAETPMRFFSNFRYRVGRRERRHDDVSRG